MVDRKSWKVGSRVIMVDCKAVHRGVIVETTAEHIKVLWDRGATSYYLHNSKSDVEIEHGP